MFPITYNSYNKLFTKKLIFIYFIRSFLNNDIIKNMINYLTNLFSGGYDNGGDVTVICSDSVITVHSFIIKELSVYYESIIPKSIIYLKDYNSNIVRLLFAILYGEYKTDIKIDNILHSDDKIKFFELVNKFNLKIDINIDIIN